VLKKIFATLCVLFTLAPLAASAHEVYVLTPTEIKDAVSMTSPNPFQAVSGEERLFLLCGAIALALVVIVFSFSFNSLFERVFDPFLVPLERYAPLVGRITLGLALLSSGYYSATFGPELPVGHEFAVILLVLGALILFGLFTRLAALIALGVFVFQVEHYHLYMLTYVNYLGEIILALILGGGRASFDRGLGFLNKIESAISRLTKRLEKYSFLILRLFYGTAVFFASFYAKFLHSNLALYTIRDYHLTNYFPFSPLFLVLGALIVEGLLGLCFFIGFEVRFAALVFTFFLTLSILFFGESVWPHIILFGVNIAIFLRGYDKYTLGHLIQGDRVGEPVL
jgi:uncharacterized membrane protein YphA (DoxX/SURF4 family)